MNKTIITILMVLLPLGAMATNIDFDQYQEKNIYTGKPAKPDLKTHKEARRYRTAIREQAKEGPNFAGRFKIVEIGCGTSCVRIAVVNEETGEVYLPRTPNLISWGGWWHELYGPEYKINSRLLVVYGQVNSSEVPYGVSYFEWQGKDFKLIHFEQQDRGKPPE